ncbi:MAG: LysM peptidoglycan-binding domain-containing protein [Bacteroidota bacterium]
MMKKSIYFLAFAMFVSAGTLAQVPRSLPDLPSADKQAPKGSSFSAWNNSKEPVEEQLDAFMKDYHFRSPTSSTYDTLLLNTQNFKAHEIPKYSEQVIRRRLNELPMLISMDYNVFVQRYIDVYSVKRRDQVSRMMGLSKIYFPMFEEELDKRGMPLELKYLPIVESALNPHARSRVGATGMWQFMLGTARMYGLKVNSFVDERKDPYKSTLAAMSYLENSYEEFGDWLLAIASYNCGPGNVRKAILRSGGKRNFWEIRDYLPRETRGYVPAFIAATYVFNYASEHNIYPIYVDYDMHQDTLHLSYIDITLTEIATMCDVDVHLLKNLNPELKLDRVPYTNDPYVLKVPSKVSHYFARYPERIKSKYGKKRDQYIPPVQYTSSKGTTSRPSRTRTAYKPKKGEVLVYYTVRTGDVVGSIADKYGVSARNISYWNNLRRYRIKVGQKLKIYTSKANAQRAGAKRTSTATTVPQKPTYQRGSALTHTVKRGDTLWGIANRYSIPIEKLYELNRGLENKKLKIGQAIRVK